MRNYYILACSITLNVVLVGGIVYFTCMSDSDSLGIRYPKTDCNASSHEDENEDEDEEEGEDSFELDDDLSYEVKDDFEDVEGENEDYKMMLCVNSSLGMSKGKLSAQCGHASIGAYEIGFFYAPNVLNSWRSSGSAKVTLKAGEEQDLLKLREVRYMSPHSSTMSGYCN